MRLGTQFYLCGGGEILLFSPLRRGLQQSGYCCRTGSSEATEDAQRNRASRRENEELTVFIVAISDTLCRSHQNDNAIVSPFLQKIQANQLVLWIFFNFNFVMFHLV